MIMALLAAGCSSRGTLRVSDLDRPLLELQQVAAHSLPLGLKSTSANGREFFSRYFVANLKERKFKPAENSPERRFAQILVLGDRRPYTVQIVVHVERRDTDRAGGYSEVGTDVTAAEVIRRRFSQKLSERREDLNIIDDFRVF